MPTVASFLVALLVATAAAAQPLRLNNFVTELFRRDQVRLEPRASFTFRNPRPGWVYLSLRADPRPGERVTLSSGGGVLLEITPATPPAVHALRLLREGEHAIDISATAPLRAGPLVIRAVAETHFIRYPNEPRFPELGSFSWDWLKANVLDPVSLIAGAGAAIPTAEVEEWTARGRKFIGYGTLPREPNLTGEGAFAFWASHHGFQHPRFSGLIADEFSGRQHPLYPAWIEGMRLLGERMRGSGRAFYAYTGGPGMHSRPEARALVQTVIDSGFYMAWERYHHEMPTEAEGRRLMDQLLGEEIVRWRAAFPRLLPHLVMVLGVFATGPELDVQANVNYKVWMDMQARYLATHPGFDGLFGLQWWYSGGASEELLRWMSALYRHYAIEGSTELLSRRYGWSYSLPHADNPDFVRGLDGWQAAPAEPGSLKTGYLERFARGQNRYWHRTAEPDYPDGDHYLWTRRHAGAPNQVSQVLKHLTPGRTYSAQMISADYQDIRQGRSRKAPHAVSLTIDGAQILPELSYRSVPVSSPYSHEQLPFLNGPAWFNHHRVMFRATQPTARLTISDWASPSAPGGPPGEELMFNYVQVQPYFEVIAP